MLVPEGREVKVMLVGKSMCVLVLVVSPSRTLKPLGCGRELGGSLHLPRRVTLTCRQGEDGDGERGNA